jgi:translation initiation factor IF-1
MAWARYGLARHRKEKASTKLSVKDTARETIHHTRFWLEEGSRVNIECCHIPGRERKKEITSIYKK